jgi:hypothetical protein
MAHIKIKFIGQKFIKNIKILVIKNIIEAKLWIRKYFIVFSNEILVSEDIIGRKLNILISKDTHNKNNEELLNENINLNNNNNWKPIKGENTI